MPQDWLEPLTDFGKYLKGMRTFFDPTPDPATVQGLVNQSKYMDRPEIPAPGVPPSSIPGMTRINAQTKVPISPSQPHLGSRQISPDLWNAWESTAGSLPGGAQEAVAPTIKNWGRFHEDLANAYKMLPKQHPDMPEGIPAESRLGQAFMQAKNPRFTNQPVLERPREIAGGKGLAEYHVPSQDFGHSVPIAGVEDPGGLPRNERIKVAQTVQRHTPEEIEEAQELGVRLDPEPLTGAETARGIGSVYPGPRGVREAQGRLSKAYGMSKEEIPLEAAGNAYNNLNQAAQVLQQAGIGDSNFLGFLASRPKELLPETIQRFLDDPGTSPEVRGAIKTFLDAGYKPEDLLRTGIRYLRSPETPNWNPYERSAISAGRTAETAYKNWLADFEAMTGKKATDWAAEMDKGIFGGHEIPEARSSLGMNPLETSASKEFMDLLNRSGLTHQTEAPMDPKGQSDPGSTYQVAGRHLWELSPDELAQTHEYEESMRMDLYRELFGSEADAYRHYEKMNDAYELGSPEQREAEKAMERFQDNLSEDQLDRLLSHLDQPDYPGHINRFMEAHEELDFRNAPALAHSLEDAVMNLTIDPDLHPHGMNLNNQVRYSQLRAAYEHVQKEGWSPEDFTQQLMQMAENKDMSIRDLNKLYNFLVHNFEIPFGGEDNLPIAE